MHLSREGIFPREKRSLEGRGDHAGGVSLLLLLHQLLTGNLQRDSKADLSRLLKDNKVSIQNSVEGNITG